MWLTTHHATITLTAADIVSGMLVALPGDEYGAYITQAYRTERGIRIGANYSWRTLPADAPVQAFLFRDGRLVLSPEGRRVRNRAGLRRRALRAAVRNA